MRLHIGRRCATVAGRFSICFNVELSALLFGVMLGLLGDVEGVQLALIK